MKPKLKHNKLVRCVIEALELKGIMVWKMQSGLFRTWEGRPAGQIGVPGVPDICGILHNGKFFGIEVKVGRDKQNKNQIEFQKYCKENDARYIVFRDTDSLEELLDYRLYDDD